MNLYLYKKFDEPGDELLRVARKLAAETDSLYSVTENRRSFRKLDDVINKGDQDTLLVIVELASLGSNIDEAEKRIQRCIKRRIRIVCCDIPPTYRHEITGTVNCAVLDVLLYAMDCSAKQKDLFKSSVTPGRPAQQYPEGWDEQYMKWENGEITSKQFIEWSGMKKATFYNKLTEYTSALDANKAFENKVHAG